MMADRVIGRTAAGHLQLGGFNLLPYRERLELALRRRRAAQCGTAILLGVLGAGLWTGAATWMRTHADAERANLEARLRQWQPQMDAATRAARATAAAARRDAQAAALGAPYRRIAALLAVLERERDATVRLDTLRATSSGAALDAHAASYRAAARWLARIAHEQRDWRLDIGALKPAADVSSAIATPFRFSVQFHWLDPKPRQKPAGGRA
jgi:type IV pilus assembly protein PilN